jgi:hypothetical protein
MPERKVQLVSSRIIPDRLPEEAAWPTFLIQQRQQKEMKSTKKS